MVTATNKSPTNTKHDFPDSSHPKIVGTSNEMPSNKLNGGF